MPDQSNHPAIRPGKDDVKFFINGHEVVGKKGETIITVAAREGVYIPHYCWHPALSVAGNCRLCLVEVHMPNPKDPTAKPTPAPKPVIGCQTPISPGMHVFTESALSKDCQNGMMEFLLANHPLD
ncbi:MAG TPA: 2Fe-2S iron-sulfur cluster-binding protein, partial [Candidatus Sumerlaeota bacterium]|nr:2Fe-2S iron-sulfur cluster-binding protein [Candidatus Sumerlaeota bacterium]